jgi:VIT1/CCC1 family predicted Fe2+/Mn2+ transporter
MRTLHRETHLIERIGWLRAACSANDGLISTASLIVGVPALLSIEPEGDQ